MVRMMGLLAQAKERQKQKISKQFISFYDSVLYLGEPKDEALEFVINNLRNEQTHLRLEYGELYLINIQRYQDEPDEYYYFTDDFISDHLKNCVANGFIDESSPIYNLGFAKKSFIEMLVCFGLPVSEQEQKSVQSPDLAFNDDYFEIDYYTYEMVVNERDELRERLQNIEDTVTDTQLLQQVANQQATIDSQAEQIADLKAQLEQTGKAQQPSDTPAGDDDLKKVPHQAYRAVDRILYALVKLSNADNSEPYSQNNPSLNAKITTILQNDGLPLEYEAVGNWLKRVNDLTPTNKK